MIKYTSGDIIAADVEALVNTVNCVGIMGRGIALQFKNAFPQNFKEYVRACKNGETQPGHMLIHSTGSLANPRYVINFPTKRHWKGKSRMEDIDAGLTDLKSTVERLHIRSIAIPPLGSGLGGLDWLQVRPRIEAMANQLKDVEVIIYEPAERPVTADAKPAGPPPNMTVGRALLILLMAQYRKAVLDPFVTLLEVHKLLYLLQEAGQPLKLRFEKAPYGPYASNIRHVLNTIEGYYISGYDGGADNPDKQLDIVPGAVQEAESRLNDDPEALSHLHRVFELVEGWETPHGMELLATVHWLATRETAITPQQAAEQTYAWNERKKLFTPRQIHLAFQTLQTGGWI
jgi:O-acetyl-ADP-ribose deacetylase (regulator of RNase III)